MTGGGCRREKPSRPEPDSLKPDLVGEGAAPDRHEKLVAGEDLAIAQLDRDARDYEDRRDSREK
jgi:hypothetical protein